MSQTSTLDGLLTLVEDAFLECKAAQGRDGRGEVPEDFWKSYSAMANTDGGVILLGIQEKPRGQFKVIGITETERLRKALWDNLHNPKQVSVNLLMEADIEPVIVEGVQILKIHVPRARRQLRPVHLGSNPFGGTYLRRYEGDYLADDETVRRMLAERVEDSRDERVLKNFEFDVLDMGTVAAYRNRFAAVKPGHIWIDLALPDFLERIGAWGRNREEGYAGLRLAGLLMFGRAEIVRDALPLYMLDYQERPGPNSAERWIDRLVPDGTWSGNLYDFFRRVYQKLTADLKVPFQLQDGQRVEDTPVHEALREALVNTLIHADFSGRVSVLVIKRPDMFGFRNPGRMRIPPEIAILGGNSDCRNRRLQTMFQLVGYGDHAGSGLPKIYTNWAGQHWRSPVLHELQEPEQTLMTLRMSSLVPDDAVAELSARLGPRFKQLPETARLALITALVEGLVSHDRLKQICADHPADLTKMLGTLVREGLLQSNGSGRGMVYFLPWQHRAPDSFDLAGDGELPDTSAIKPPELGEKPPELGEKPPELGTPAVADGAIYLDWDAIPPTLQRDLLELGRRVSSAGWVPSAVLRATLLALCDGRYLGLRVLARVLDRDPDDLRKRTLSVMVREGLLVAAYRTVKDPRQAYRAAPARWMG